MRAAIFRIIVVGWCASAWSVAVAEERGPLEIVSSRPGLVFAGNETIDVQVRVAGPSGPLVVEYRLEAVDGAEKSRGQISTPRLVRRQTETFSLPLSSPGPGLYRLRVQAASGRKKHQTERRLAVVFEPAPPQEASPWGIFYVPPLWFDAKNQRGPEDVAASIRRLGASWVRLGFWEHSLGDVTVEERDGRRQVRADFGLWLGYARALRAEGLHVMGCIGQVPRALSSQPHGEAAAGDGGPLYARVAPADYALWEQLVERLAREFSDTIEVWEVWNEPDNQGVYFAGTHEEFFALAQHTARALRRGNPQAKIAGSGFTASGNGLGYAHRLLELGLGRELDVVTVHYTDNDSWLLERWSALLKRFELQIPLWNSEDRSPVPLFNLAHGVPRTFKFLHVAIGYEETEPLADKDYSLRPAGLAYSVGAHCLGNARFLRRVPVAGGQLWSFARGSETVGVFQRERLSTWLAGGGAVDVPLIVTPLDSTQPPRATELSGRSAALFVDDAGAAQLRTAEALVFINGCRQIEPADGGTSGHRWVLAEAEDGRCSEAWERKERRDASGQSLLEVQTGTPDQLLELRLVAPRAGRYEVIFAGSDLARLVAPRPAGLFCWSIDGDALREVGGSPATPAGPPENGLQLHLLGSVDLLAGDHTFRLIPTGERASGNPGGFLAVDAIALRPVEEVARGSHGGLPPGDHAGVWEPPGAKCKVGGASQFLAFCRAAACRQAGFWRSSPAARRQAAALQDR